MKATSKRMVGKVLCIDYRKSSFARLGISASSHYGSSCERNRFKRLVREAFRLTRGELPPMDLHVVPRQYAKRAKLADITVEFKKLYCVYSSCVNLDSARKSKIDSEASDRRSPAPSGQGEKEDRFGEVAASPNSQNLRGRSICQS